MIEILFLKSRKSSLLKVGTPEDLLPHFVFFFFFTLRCAYFSWVEGY